MGRTTTSWADPRSLARPMRPGHVSDPPMAAKEGDGTGAGTVVGLALGGSKSSAYVLQWALANFVRDDAAPPAFKLIHVLIPVLAVPTPLKNRLPIDDVSSDISVDYLHGLWIKKQEMLRGCKDTCDEYKVEAQVLLVEGSDVADTISSLVVQYQIQILVVGNPSSKNPFTGSSSTSRTTTKICKSVPSFCTAYVVSKDGLSSIYASESESGSPSGSLVPKGNSESSETEEFITDSSRSDLDDSSGQGLPPSNLASEKLESCSSVEGFTLYDYLSGNASVYPDKDRRITPSTGSERSISSQSQGSDKVLTKESSLLGSMLSDNKGSDKVPAKENSLLGLMLSDKKNDVSTELEKLKLELGHIQGAYKLVQDESADASHQVNELATRRMEVEAQLSEIQARVDKANDDVLEQTAQRLVAEEATTQVKHLTRLEVIQKNRLLAKASKDADRKARLEKLLVLQDDSYWTFTWEEIDNATASLSESLKIGTGSNGTVYKGHLNHLNVAIKVLHCNDSSSTKHFNQELEVLSRIRHPHLVMLLGACPDKGCLVYEYMENGSLADRLQLKKGTPPIPWFDRFRIAWEIGSALVFLHSAKPSPIIHRDLKPENVLLNSNLVSKIGDVGLSTLMPPKETLSNRTVFKKTGLAGTLFYLDPEYQRSGQVSVKSDTYALGMVILELLTARSPIGLPELVERAVEGGRITDVLDEGAGEWPVKEAHELAQLGLKCLEMRSKDRPDLKSVVVVELERLKHITAGMLELARALPGLPGPPPSHFMCPILKRVMKDPVLAADGYSYERSAMEMWLCDMDTSPVTKARLRDKKLVANLSLLSAITSWAARGGGF
ncbi:U-box domain-containing protein 52-like isoform X2 [Hordeum vulgare subsp. vulgare]|uniref:U-box domain-containing protein 52-like isoform X2 n=1 Tax=Hordeum vulgare subsp. vulgare TaxID=112509 RepID=UPI001D1A333C|nr:U-box domain-containing protein 52-like isoform X2 [Hordeum vulgare subsp. vulgare]